MYYQIRLFVSGQHPISFVCGMSDLIGGIPESAATMSSLGKFRSEYSFGTFRHI